MQRKTARSAAEAGDVPSLMAVGQSAAQEAIEQSMQYWSQMFELIVEIQKRLFSLMEDQTAGRARRQGGEGGDGDDARHDEDAERRLGDAGRDVVGRLGVRVDAEGDGRFRPDVGDAALRAGPARIPESLARGELFRDRNVYPAITRRGAGRGTGPSRPCGAGAILPPRGYDSRALRPRVRQTFPNVTH